LEGGRGSANICGGSSVEGIVSDVISYVESLLRGNVVTYLRISLVLSNINLHLFKGVVRGPSVITHIISKLSEPHVVGLLRNAMKLGGGACLEIRNHALTNFCDEKYLGTLYMGYPITPLSYAVSFSEIRGLGGSDLIVVEDNSFNICALNKDLKLVGCIIKQDQRTEDLVSKLNTVANAVNTLVSGVDVTKLKSVTWLLCGDEVIVIDLERDTGVFSTY